MTQLFNYFIEVCLNKLKNYSKIIIIKYKCLSMFNKL